MIPLLLAHISGLLAPRAASSNLAHAAGPAHAAVPVHAVAAHAAPAHAAGPAPSERVPFFVFVRCPHHAAPAHAAGPAHAAVPVHAAAAHAAPAHGGDPTLAAHATLAHATHLKRGFYA